MKKKKDIYAYELNGCYSVKQIDFINSMMKKFNASLSDILRAIYSVGTCEDNIKDYLKNYDTSETKKDMGFTISYTAHKLTEKDKIISDLKSKLNSTPIPKFNIGDEVYTIEEKWDYIGDTYSRTRTKYINKQYIAWYKVYKPNKKQSKPSIAYRLKSCGYCRKAYLYFEKDIFLTEDEAKLELKKREKDEK